jgi:hypothetical protein
MAIISLPRRLGWSGMTPQITVFPLNTFTVESDLADSRLEEQGENLQQGAFAAAV